MFTQFQRVVIVIVLNRKKWLFDLFQQIHLKYVKVPTKHITIKENEKNHDFHFQFKVNCTVYKLLGVSGNDFSFI